MFQKPCLVSLSTATIARILRLAGVSYLGLVAGFSASAPRLSLQPRRALAHQLRGGASSATMADAASVLKQQRASWQQTMLRIKDPVKSVAFYRDVMGMTLIDKLEFPDMTFDLYFLTTLPEGETYPHTPGPDEAHQFQMNAPHAPSLPPIPRSRNGHLSRQWPRFPQ